MIDRFKALLAGARRRSGFVDHAVRAFQRIGGDNGNSLASVITVPGFLSFFPLVALALSVAGFVAHYDAHAQAQITDSLKGFFPGLIGPGKGQINVGSIADQRAATGIVGLVGLLFGGLGWISAMRYALRTIWRQPEVQANFVVAKLLDIGVLIGVGLAILGSLLVTAAATAAAQIVVDHTPLPAGGLTEIGLRILAIALAVGGDVLLFGFLFLRLPDVEGHFRQVLSGAVFGAIGFEILKSVGAIYIAHTTNNPLYASFAVVIGLLVWTNLVARLFLFSAVWAVTRPYDSDVPPSGTALRRGEIPAVVPDRQKAAPMRPATDAAVAAGRSAGGAALGIVGAVTLVVARHSWNTIRDATRPRRY